MFVANNIKLKVVDKNHVYVNIVHWLCCMWLIHSKESVHYTWMWPWLCWESVKNNVLMKISMLLSCMCLTHWKQPVNKSRLFVISSLVALYVWFIKNTRFKRIICTRMWPWLCVWFQINAVCFTFTKTVNWEFVFIVLKKAILLKHNHDGQFWRFDSI